MWTMLMQKKSGKWELVKSTSSDVMFTGYVSSDKNVMMNMVRYMNYGFVSDLPLCIIDDLDFIKMCN